MHPKLSHVLEPIVFIKCDRLVQTAVVSAESFFNRLSILLDNDTGETYLLDVDVIRGEIYFLELHKKFQSTSKFVNLFDFMQNVNGIHNLSISSSPERFYDDLRAVE